MTKKTTLAMLIATCLFSWGCDTKTKSVDACGDGFVDPGEECDTSVGDNTCASLGYYNSLGTLTCTSDCQYDVSSCGGRCGDGDVQADDSEDCDGTDLNGNSCQSLGYHGGSLSCDSGCRFVLANCEALGQCGDEEVQATFEQCDGSNMNDHTCETLGNHPGTLSCTEMCGFDLTGCGGRCGDGTLQQEFGENCDGENLNSRTCADQGYSVRAGTLTCTAVCLFDESGCLELSNNAELASLSLSIGTLTPAFSSEIDSYFVTVPLSVESITVEAIAADSPYATVAISPSQPVALSEGSNPVLVTVTAENGMPKNYNINIIQALESQYVGMMIYIPGGTFQRDNIPENLSVVSAFRMSRYEITRAQWTTVTGWADPSAPTASSGTSDPLQQMTDYEVIAFCNKLSLLEGLTPVYSVNGVDFNTLSYAQIPTVTDSDWTAATANWSASGYRLPTEMEWMWAMMGADTSNPGAVNTNGYTKTFSGSNGSNAIGDYAVFGYNSSDVGRTTTSRSNPVGSKLSNELGIYDLSGNVFELLWDRDYSIPQGTLIDYRGPSSGFGRVYRGGSWSEPASRCSLERSDVFFPSSRFSRLGFRVVRNGP